MNGYAIPRSYDHMDDHLSFALARDDLIDEEAETEAGLEPVTGLRVRVDTRAATAELAPPAPVRRQRTISATSGRTPVSAPTRPRSGGHRRLRRQSTGLASPMVIAVAIGCVVGAVMFITWHQRAPLMMAGSTATAAATTPGKHALTP